MWINKDVGCVCVCVCVMKYYIAIKNNEIMPFAATWMDLEIINLNEVSRREKDKHYMLSLICGIWKKNTVNELINETVSQQICGCQG